MLFFCAKAQEFGWKEPQKQRLKDWEFDELNQETSGFKALTFAKYFFMSFDANVWQKRTSCKRQQVVFHSKAYLQKNNNNQMFYSLIKNILFYCSQKKAGLHLFQNPPLVRGFNPFDWIISPGFGVKIKNLWNHHPVQKFQNLPKKTPRSPISKRHRHDLLGDPK